MSKKKLVIFGPYDEFTQFIKFNSLIRRIKRTKEYSEIIVVVPYTALAIVADADKIITVTHEFHEKTNSHYPVVLDRADHHNCYTRQDMGYCVSGFMEIALGYIQKEYEKDEVKIGIYTEESVSPEIMKLLPDDVEYESAYVEGYAGFCKYHNQFCAIADEIESGATIKPFIEDQKAIKEKYAHLFENPRTYVLHTRGFRNKQPGVYNAEKGIDALGFRITFNDLMKDGYKFINVGFPPAHYEFDNENYIEFTDDLTYSEYLAFCSLAAGWVMFSDAGGWITHITSELDIFSVGPEWANFGTGAHGYQPLLEKRIARKELFTGDVRSSDPSKLYELLKNHKPQKYNHSLPSIKEKVIIIDE